MDTSTRGTTLIELLVIVALLLIGVMLSFPASVRFRSRSAVGAAARNLALEIQDLRWRSVTGGTGHGLFFDRDPEGWFWHRVRDGNGNGLRTAEVRNGTDPLIGPLTRVEARVPGVRLGFPGPGPFPGIPPSRGSLTTDDPIRIGNSSLLAFGPLGGGTGGTLFLTDGKNELFAVVVYGHTTRVRVWHYERETRRWRL